ncbi:MAG: hypothetical protein ABSG78_23315 [Verrucomicrobiota bacterium]|jgi:hypothetical protein
MKLGIMSGIACAGMVSLLVSQSVQGQNLLANPGFETGDFTGWTLSGSTAFEGVSTSFATTPSSGSYSAFFGAVGSYNIISQTISTAVGDKYNISFALDNSGGPYSEAFVDWGGTQVWDVQPSGTFGWNVLGFNEVATGTSTTISFGFEQVPSYFNLDNTAVVDITNPNVTPGNAPPFVPVLNTTITDEITPNDKVPDQPVGLWATAATLLGLCAVAGCRRRQQAV